MRSEHDVAHTQILIYMSNSILALAVVNKYSRGFKMRNTLNTFIDKISRYAQQTCYRLVIRYAQLVLRNKRRKQRYALRDLKRGGQA